MTKQGPADSLAKMAARNHAKRWVQNALMAESLRSTLAEEEPRQFTVRLNPVVASLFEAMAARLRVSRNNAANLLLGIGLLESLSALSDKQREELLKEMEKSLGRKLDLTPPPESEIPGVFDGMLGDLGGMIEDIKSMFRGTKKSG